MISQEHETSDWKYYIWPNYFSPEQCKEIGNVIDNNYISSGEGDFTARNNKGEPLKAISNVKSVAYGAIKHLIHPLINEAFYIANNKFGYLTFGPYDVEQLNFNTYSADSHDQYRWHIDESPNSQEDIKLTLLINLSTEEYEGGEFETYVYEKKRIDEFSQPGSVYMFPSKFHHRVLPVTSGTRKSLTFFITGPRFR